MPPRKTTSTSTRAQDKPFVYKSKTGTTITIPSKVKFDPDLDALIEMKEAADAGQEMAATAALGKFIKSGFPEDVAKDFKIKLSEQQDFITKYQKHTGTDIPK